MPNTLRRARDGYGNEVIFMKKPVYHYSLCGDPPLVYSTYLDKKQWIKDNIDNEDNYEMVYFMMIDWDLFWSDVDYLWSTLVVIAESINWLITAYILSRFIKPRHLGAL